MAHPPRGFLWLAAGTILLSAFLLFQVQPLISKAILPWFGGSPAVWSTCMLFFQVLLLAGYAYADLIVRLRSKRLQMIIHTTLVVVALTALPITPHDRWKPTDGQFPTERILLVLAVSVGVPYFLLSTTGPLVQVWFARATGGASPYRLYALSNIGSLVALITYPFLFERFFDVPVQGRLWSGGFLAFAAMCVVSGWQSLRSMPSAEMTVRTEEEGSPPTVSDWCAWLALPALAVVALLAVTNHLCRDVAVVPFLWIAPLTLYLLSFIVCFDREAWYVRRWWSLASALSTLSVIGVLLAKHIDHYLGRVGLSLQIAKYSNNVLVEGTIYLVWLWLACMLCHGELVRRKPPARRLTSFYLCLAAGGALGGVFVALVCPRVFSYYWELHLVLGGVYLVALGVLGAEGSRHWFPRSRWLFAAYLLAGGTGGFWWMWTIRDTLDETVVARVRDFYGVLTIKEHYEEDPQHHGYGLYNGRILHGFQFLAPERRMLPTTYYHEDSAAGLVLHWLQATRERVKYGVVGLGTGTMAAFARENDTVSFYEIDPEVIVIQDRYFYFYNDCPATKSIVLGDARIQMERQEPQQFDALFVDAFSGDAVPTHLLTREALATYRKHLKPDGIVAFHVSNRFLDLDPLVLGLARDAGLGVAKFREPTHTKLFDTSSEWIVVTANQTFLQDEQLVKKQAAFSSPRGLLWTDQFSNLWDVLR